MKRVKDQEVDSNKQKADKTVECVKIECLEETLNKLRSELKSALQVLCLSLFVNVTWLRKLPRIHTQTYSHSTISKYVICGNTCMTGARGISGGMRSAARRLRAFAV